MSNEQRVSHRSRSPWFSGWETQDESEPAAVKTLPAQVQSAPAYVTTNLAIPTRTSLPVRKVARPSLRRRSIAAIWSATPIGLILIATVLTYLYLDSHFYANVASISAQVLCFATAFSLVVATNYRTLFTSARKIRISRKSLVITILVIGIAIALRYLFWRYMPFAQQTGFEELQAGGDTRGILIDSQLPIEFRFTKVLSSLGFFIGGLSLDALREPFRVAACIGIVLVALSLRRLSVSWWAILFAVVSMATLRWLVIAGGTADELFAPIPLVCLIIFCVVASETSTENRPAWMGLAGIAAGMLAYEYTSYRVIPAVIAVWLLGKSITAKAGSKHSQWLSFVLFVSALSIIAAPTFLQVIHDPNNSTFLEAFRRHSVERRGFDTYLVDSLGYLRQYAFGLFGLQSQASYDYTRPDESVVLPVIGFIFAASLVVELIKPSRSISRLLSLSVIVTVLSASFSANNYNIGRMSPCLPELLILSALFLQRFAALITSRFSRGAIGFAIAASLLSFAVVTINLISIQLTSSDASVLQEYSRDPYGICHRIGEVAGAGQTVYLYAIGNSEFCSGDASWLYRDSRIDLHQLGDLPIKDELKPNDIVVIGKVGGLDASETSRFAEFVSSTDSAAPLHMSYDIYGRKIVESFCFKCTQR